MDKMIVWSDGPSCEFRNQFCTGKLLYEMSQLIGRVSFWKYFAAGHGKGVCDGIGGSLKARVAEHCRGKKSDNVTVQTFEDFFKVGQRLCPLKVTLFKLSKEDVQMTTALQKLTSPGRIVSQFLGLRVQFRLGNFLERSP